MSTSSSHYNQGPDAKLATESAPPGMYSITNTVGMHPSTNQPFPPIDPSHGQHSSCYQYGCTADHSGKQHQ